MEKRTTTSNNVTSAETNNRLTSTLRSQGIILFIVLASYVNLLLFAGTSPHCPALLPELTVEAQPGDNNITNRPREWTKKAAPPHYAPTKYERETISRMVNHSFARSKVSPVNRSSFFRTDYDRCALNFYGLPRSFLHMTLPSVIENILIPNLPYDCDIYVHYHYKEAEAQSRSGDGGKLNPNEIFLLEEAMRQVGAHVLGATYRPIIRFANYTDEEFWKTHGALLNRTRTTFDDLGRNIYLPRPDPSYTNEVTDNIIRMWHSQQKVFELMDETAQELEINYTRVAMFRSDVFFLTRIDILENGEGGIDYENRKAVFPGFAKSPTNDRMVVGPYQGVRQWAIKRFILLNSHLVANTRISQKWGMHSEMFVFRYVELSVVVCVCSEQPYKCVPVCLPTGRFCPPSNAKESRLLRIRKFAFYEFVRMRIYGLTKAAKGDSGTVM